MDIERLLQAVEGESPCGEDLAYDADFREMEQAAQGQPERQMGETVIEAVPPNWDTVREKAVALLERSKDLRSAVFLTQAGVRIDGLAGLNAGLELIAGLLEQYWPLVHPQLDPDYDNDPTRRVNVLNSLAVGETLRAALRDDVVLADARAGSITLRDIQLAEGDSPAPAGDGDPPPDMAAIESAFAGCDLSKLTSSAEEAQRSLEHLAAINAALAEVLDPVQAPDLDPLEKQLKLIGGILQERVDRRAAEGDSGVAGEDGAGAAAGGAAPGGVPGRINSREEALRVLDLVSEYFERSEPSSPVPILLKRAQRLVSKDFMEILKDLAPDGLSQAETFRGSEPE